jgi:hypothetical protein
MNKRDRDPGNRSGCAMLAAMVLASVCIPLLIFLPLILSLLEAYFFGTDHVYKAFVRMGIADELQTIYEPVVDLVVRLFN